MIILIIASNLILLSIITHDGSGNISNIHLCIALRIGQHNTFLNEPFSLLPLFFYYYATCPPAPP